MRNRLKHRAFRHEVALVFSLLASVGCKKAAEVPATQVMVFVTADDTLASNVDEIRIQVASEQPRAFDVSQRDIRASEDPLRIAIVPQNDDATRQYQVFVELVDIDDEGEHVLGTQTMSGGFIKDEFREVWMSFDGSCRYVNCPSGFRCQEDECVEHCVESSEVGETTRSRPVACDDPCTADACLEDQQRTCQSGAWLLERECASGCNDSEQACRRLVPSNADESVSPTGLDKLVVGEGTLPTVAFDTTLGSVVRQSTDESEEICLSCDATRDGIGFEVVTAGTAQDCDGNALEYGVFSLDSLRVLENATLRGMGARPLIIIAEGDIVIDGEIDVTAIGDADPGSGMPGPGGCRGATGDPPSSGRGIGAGGPGSTGFNVAGGGGAASYGGLGGIGGQAGGWPGGIRGSQYGSENLIPLLGGSGGGSGGDGGPGGHGGGAIQLSSRAGRIFVNDAAMLSAGGSGGGSSTETGGGAGSGGAILLEAGQLICPAGSGLAHLGAPGGGGGGTLDGAQGATGDPGSVPAPGGEGGVGGVRGGAGSEANGMGSDGLNEMQGSGGGAGAGRIRLNSLAGAATCDAPQPCGERLEPVTCGNVQLE